MPPVAQARSTLLDTARRVETPEGVELALDVAGPFPRALAWCVDWLLRLVVGGVLGFLSLLLGQFGAGVTLLMSFLLLFGYPIVFEVLRGGTTPGKKALGLVVVQFDGAPVGWRASATRNLLRAADFLPAFYGFGFLAMNFSDSFQRLGDRAAGTLVVHAEHVGRVRTLMEVEPRAPRMRLTREDRRVIDSFAARLGDLSRPRAYELANLASRLTEASDEEGVKRLVGLARWLRGER